MFVLSLLLVVFPSPIFTQVHFSLAGDKATAGEGDNNHGSYSTGRELLEGRHLGAKWYATVLNTATREEVLDVVPVIHGVVEGLKDNVRVCRWTVVWWWLNATKHVH